MNTSLARGVSRWELFSQYGDGPRERVGEFRVLPDGTIGTWWVARGLQDVFEPCFYDDQELMPAHGRKWVEAVEANCAMSSTLHLVPVKPGLQT